MKIEFNVDFKTGDTDLTITACDDFEQCLMKMPGITSTILDEIAVMMLNREPEPMRNFIKETMILSLITGFYKDADAVEYLPAYNSPAYKALFDAITLWSKEFMGGEEYERA